MPEDQLCLIRKVSSESLTNVLQSVAGTARLSRRPIVRKTRTIVGHLDAQPVAVEVRIDFDPSRPPNRRHPVFDHVLDERLDHHGRDEGRLDGVVDRHTTLQALSEPRLLHVEVGLDELDLLLEGVHSRSDRRNV